MASRPLQDPRLLAAAEVLLEVHADGGLQYLPRPGRATPVPEPAAAPAAAPGAAAALEALAARIASCERCGLCETRKQTVPGEGAPAARVMFVGEAPGADEDASGRPFVGAAGRLLTKIIESGMGLRRDDVFIANILKCRPPGNRDPQADEKELCTPFLEEQIAIVRPEVVIALGRHAGSHLLGRPIPLNQMRGSLHAPRGGGPPILVTFHPAYLLRSPAAKSDCWKDIQMAMRHLGLPGPARGST